MIRMIVTDKLQVEEGDVLYVDYEGTLEVTQWRPWFRVQSISCVNWSANSFKGWDSVWLFSSEKRPVWSFWARQRANYSGPVLSSISVDDQIRWSLYKSSGLHRHTDRPVSWREMEDGGEIVNCPTRWSLSFGFLFSSSRNKGNIE